MHLSSQHRTNAAAYAAIAVATLATVLAALTGFGATGRRTMDGAGISAVSGDIPLHSVEVTRDEHGRFVTAEGVDAAEIAERLKNLPPEAPVPVVLVRLPASVELQAVPPILRQLSSLGIKKVAILME